MQKLLAFLVVVLVLAGRAAGGLIWLFHSPQKNWQNIHPNLVYKTKAYRGASWYPLAARVLNLPPAKAVPLKGVGGEPLPDSRFLTGSLEVNLDEGGFYYLKNFKQYSPGALLSFKNLSTEKKVETLFNVEVIDPKGGTIFYRTRKFINLKPGAQTRDWFGKREEILFARPGEAPPLALRVTIPGVYTRNLKIPRRLLKSPSE